MSSNEAEGLEWYRHLIQQRHRLQRSRVGMPLPKHKQRTADVYMSPREDRQPAASTLHPRLQDAKPTKPPVAKPRPIIKGWNPPPNRIACSIIASQEMQAFYARENRHKHASYLRLLRVPSVEHASRAHSLRSSIRAMSMRSSAKASGVHGAPSELQTLHWARQHATDNVERWAQHTAVALIHKLDDAKGDEHVDHQGDEGRPNSTSSSASSSAASDNLHVTTQPRSFVLRCVPTRTAIQHRCRLLTTHRAHLVWADLTDRLQSLSPRVAATQLALGMQAAPDGSKVGLACGGVETTLFTHSQAPAVWECHAANYS